MPSFSFFDNIQNNDVVKNYHSFIDIIYIEIINTLDQNAPLKFSDISIFPMLVHIGMGNINIIHHTTLGKINIITKIEMYKTIMGLDEKGSPKEIRDFDKDPIHSRKSIKLDNILNVSSAIELHMKCLLSTQSTTFYQSYTFCLSEFISILHDTDQSDWNAMTILFKFIMSIKDSSISNSDKQIKIDSFTHIISWLLNVANGKIGSFPFHHRISKAANNWYIRICNSIFGYFPLNDSKKRPSTISSSGYCSDNESSYKSINKRPRTIEIQKQEKTKWNKLHPFLCKIILFASYHHSCKILEPSRNYIKFLQCNSTKSDLLLLTTVASKEQVSFWVQPNLLSNMMKGFLCTQLILFPEGLNPFKTSSAPSNQSLS
jgi:hypothetical protein